jgi:hypothetical protein
MFGKGDLQEMMMMKVSTDTLRMINKLPKIKREKVDAIVRRHVAACQRNGFLPENIERVFIEAMEMIDLEKRFPEPVREEIRDWQPARRYDQYVSPKAA